jgi:AcrR family transcriptional regulator
MNMDRRQRKTRKAIFSAFTQLLARKNYNEITVQDIVERADIGRTTFYSHFETKEFLLRDLCGELFGHIIETAMGLPKAHYHYVACEPTDSVFLHLVRHLQENDRSILELLASPNDQIFLGYFKDGLVKMITSQYAAEGRLGKGGLPEGFLVNHMAASFVETIAWWLSRGMPESAEVITGYFLATVEPLL